MYVVCVLCLIVVPLPPGENPFAVKINIYLSMKSSIFWDPTPCNTLKGNRRFEGTFLLDLQGRRISRARNQREAAYLEDGGNMFLRNVQLLSTGIHGIIIHYFQARTLHNHSCEYFKSYKINIYVLN
jgi:hypothetical protein